jgi:hypothetical protein
MKFHSNDEVIDLKPSVDLNKQENIDEKKSVNFIDNIQAVSSTSLITIGNDSLKKSATLQLLNAQKRMKLMENKKNKLKLPTTSSSSATTTIVSHYSNPITSTTNTSSPSTTNINNNNNNKSRIKSAKSEKQVQIQQQTTNTNLQEMQHGLINYELHLQRDYINKQNKLILNKIKNYSKNGQIEEMEISKMNKEFATNYFDTKHNNYNR